MTVKRKRKNRRSDEECTFARPWYAHTDRWEVVHEKEYLPPGVRDVIRPRRIDPCFGASVELRVLEGEGFEVYVCSGDDDGRYVVRMTGEEMAGLARRLRDGFTIPGTSRGLNDDEVEFLGAAIKEASKR